MLISENLNQKPRITRIEKMIIPKVFSKLKIFRKHKKETKIKTKYNKIDTFILKKFIKLIKKKKK
jgi:hypothetical protein